MATAAESYHTSHHACRYLVQTMVKREPLDQQGHSKMVSDACHSLLQKQAIHDFQMNDRQVRGHPANKHRHEKLFMGTGDSLSATPYCLNGAILSSEEWHDNARLFFNLEPLDMPQHCDGCMAKMTVEHALSCKKGGLVHAHHDDVASEWRWLSHCAFSPGKVEHGPYINSSIDCCLREIAAAGQQQHTTT